MTAAMKGGGHLFETQKTALDRFSGKLSLDLTHRFFTGSKPKHRFYNLNLCFIGVFHLYRMENLKPCLQ